MFLKSNPHPRAYGNFARAARPVRARREADPARGGRPPAHLAARREPEARASAARSPPGFFADVVVFDPAQIQDHATFEPPHQYATGVHDVFVNGVQVLEDGEHTGAKPGRVVRGPGWKGGAAARSVGCEPVDRAATDRPFCVAGSAGQRLLRILEADEVRPPPALDDRATGRPSKSAAAQPARRHVVDMRRRVRAVGRGRSRPGLCRDEHDAPRARRVAPRTQASEQRREIGEIQVVVASLMLDSSGYRQLARDHAAPSSRRAPPGSRRCAPARSRARRRRWPIERRIALAAPVQRPLVSRRPSGIGPSSTSRAAADTPASLAVRGPPQSKRSSRICTAPPSTRTGNVRNGS